MPGKKYHPVKWDEEKAATAEGWATMTPEAFATETGGSSEDHAALRDAVLHYTEAHRTAGPAEMSPTPAPPPGVAPLLREGSAASPEMQEAAGYSAPVEDNGPGVGEAFARGLGRGATADFMDEGASALMGAGDKIAGWFGGGVKDPEGIPREYAAGSRYKDNRNTIRAENDAAAEAHPVATGVGMALGAAPSAIAAGGGSAGLKGAAALGRTALEGAAFGGAQGAGSSEAEDVGGVASDALSGAKTGAMTAAGAAGVLRGVGKLNGSSLGKMADKSRGASYGLYGAQMRNLVQNLPGKNAAEKTAAYSALIRDSERLGAHKGTVVGGFDRAAENLDNIRQTSGQAIGQSEDQILASPSMWSDQNPAGTVAMDQRPMVAELRKGASDMKRMKDPAAASDASFASTTADNYAEPQQVAGPNGTPHTVEKDYIPLKDAIANKRDVYDRINWSRKGGSDASPNTEVVRKNVGANLKRGVESTLTDAAGRGEVDPELVKRWLQANKDFHTSATFADPAQARVYQEAGNSPVGLLPMIAAEAAFVGHGAGAAAATALAGKAIKTRIPAALANTQRALSNVNRGISSVVTPAAGPVGNITAQQMALLQQLVENQRRKPAPPTEDPDEEER